MSQPQPPPSNRFAIVASESRESAQKAAEHARQRFTEAGAEVFSLEQVLAGQEVDALLSLGGDGTLLHAARLMAPRSVPVLGVNFGRLGYLCSAQESQLNDAVDALCSHQFRVDARDMVRTRVFNRREEVWQVDALNEVLVGGSTRTLTLELSANGEALGLVRGDGVIIATRTGSSAYAYSAGGPILLMEALVMVTSNEITSSIATPVVFPRETALRLANRSRGVRPYVIADGQKDYQIDEGTEIEIFTSPIKALLVDPGWVSAVGKLKTDPGGSVA
ncbi:MAG: NAD(+)/NADH kinase [Vulcanimicrobiota bacterium]